MKNILGTASGSSISGITDQDTVVLPKPSKATRTMLERLQACQSQEAKLVLCARTMLCIFDDFYSALCDYPLRAKRAFENISPQQSLRISHERLGLYSNYIAFYGPQIKSAFPRLAEDESLLDLVIAYFRPLIAARYEADIAYGFAHSLRRNIYHGIWRPVAYSFSRPVESRYMSQALAHQRFSLVGGIDTTLLLTILQIPRFKAAFEDIDRDISRLVLRWQSILASNEFEDTEPLALDVLESGFYRDYNAFLVARVVWQGNRYTPFIIAFRNGENGIYLDALLYKRSDAHNLFSSTLANFHVTNPLYYQVCVFLYSLMPRRPLGLHYSTIGFNHVGKVAILEDIEKQLDSAGRQFVASDGAEGTVAIGFSFDECEYHLKVIRDKPTASYKWGEFIGVDAVLDKYRIVHEINRTGSMLDNVMYHTLKMNRQWFGEELLNDLLTHAGDSVHVDGDSVFFHELIVQLKITPLPFYLESANDDDIEQVMYSLGNCIKNNMYANIFNKDLDVRNYGVGRYGKVFLFDYDALEKLTDIHLDTNLGMDDGEEDIPDWFFSEKPVFLPEELESGLQISNRQARQAFKAYHGDLLTLQLWQDVQTRLKNGEVLALSTYPDERRLC